MKNKKAQRKRTDHILKLFIYGCTAITVATLVFIVGFILYKGLPSINIDFLTRQWDDKTTIVTVQPNQATDPNLEDAVLESYGITLEDTDEGVAIKHIEKNSPVLEAKNQKKKVYRLKQGDMIEKVNSTRIKAGELQQAIAAFDENGKGVKLKVVRLGGGIIPMLVSTLYIIVLSLFIAAPIGILSAIYLNEYAKKGKLLTAIRFAIQNLAGIPSIIYGLFGMLVFVQLMNMQYSILAGSLTLSIILLPTMISTTEEALKAIPYMYRESSLGLGATKLQTVAKVVVPNALPGILVAVILSIGRIVGESAALIFTAGTVAVIPTALVGSSASAATMTTKLYWLIKESGDLQSACAIAVIILLLIFVLNMISKVIAKRFLSKTQ